MWLDVDVVGPEESLCPFDREGFRHVNELAPPIVAPPRVPLGILVGQGGARRFHHRGAHKVLRGDELQLGGLAFGLEPDDFGDFRVDVDKVLHPETPFMEGGKMG
ncbi:MAG: short-chain dehydrogenase/reductase [candidate division NC10 bacterium]|nr:short-chain dehydrogenase/reductase [candidate division NC10 bacterium]